MKRTQNLHLVGALVFCFSIFAQRSWSSEEEYNFSWLDPEKKVYVLQNRKYTKAYRPQISVMGTLVSTPSSYRNTYSVDGRFAFYLHEDFGIEILGQKFFNSENNVFQALKLNSPNTLPLVREVSSQWGILAQWSPWYGKVNLFNNIMYFDWYLSGGVGQVQTALDTRLSTSAAPVLTPETLLAWYVGTGHQYHLSQNIFARLDVTGSFFQATYLRSSGEKTWFSNFTYGLGFGFRL